MRKILAAALAGALILGTSLAYAADPDSKTVAKLYQEKSALSGKLVRVKGKVVKVNNGIMGRNFVHVQDGTGDAKAGTNNLVVTSKQTAAVGDQVSISGLVVINKDFGSGYSYPLLIEEATVTVKK